MYDLAVGVAAIRFYGGGGGITFNGILRFSAKCASKFVTSKVNEAVSGRKQKSTSHISASGYFWYSACGIFSNHSERRYS
jgi:hypothetical protein